MSNFVVFVCLGFSCSVEFLLLVCDYTIELGNNIISTGDVIGKLQYFVFFILQLYVLAFDDFILPLELLFEGVHSQNLVLIFLQSDYFIVEVHISLLFIP